MYYIVREQYIDPFDQRMGVYKNELKVMKSFRSLKDVRAELSWLRKIEGVIAKYRYGYIKACDIRQILNFK